MSNINKSFRRQRSSLEVNLSWNSTNSVDNITICNKNDTVFHYTRLRNRSILLENASKDNELSSNEMSSFPNKFRDNDRKNKLCQSIRSSPKEKGKKLYLDKPKEPKSYMEENKYKLCQLLSTTHISINDVTKCHGLQQNLELNGKNGLNIYALSTLGHKAQTERFSSYSVLKTKNIPIFVEQELGQIDENTYQASSLTSGRELSCENTNITSSLNSKQSSLNVNTSDHVTMARNISTYNHKQKNTDDEKCRILETKQNHICSAGLNEVEETINSIGSSLQMNTSVGTFNRLQDTQISILNSCNTEVNDFVDLKTRNFKPQSPEKFVLDEVHNNNQDNIVHDMIILTNTVSKKLYNTSEISSFTKESIDENEPYSNKNEQDLKQFLVKPKRKKLLPLQECSQLLSFSPIQEECMHPQPKIFIRKQKKKKNKYYKTKKDLNNVQCSATEENINVLKKKQVRKPRKVVSKKIIVKKINSDDMFSRLEIGRNNDKIDREFYTLNRGSSNDFQPIKIPLTVQVSSKPREKMYIVVTGIPNKDKNLVRTIVKTLGFAKIESNVTKHTTHVVTTGLRTINLLHAIIRGCWLVSLEWILQSSENNSWINPEKYEMTHVSKAVLENRKDRQLYGKSYVPELFAACGYIYIKDNTIPPSNVLKDLVKAAGGCISENMEKAKIVIGCGGLKESWILDCITLGELQPYHHYQQS